MKTAPSKAKARRTRSRSNSLLSRTAKAWVRFKLKPRRGILVSASVAVLCGSCCSALNPCASCKQATKASSRVSPAYCCCNSAGVPTANTLAACIKEIRSQRSASFIKWVDKKIVTPCSRDNSNNSRQKSSRAAGSTPEVGSSRINTSGSWITATAKDRRWRKPNGKAPACSLV